MGPLPGPVAIAQSCSRRGFLTWCSRAALGGALLHDPLQAAPSSGRDTTAATNGDSPARLDCTPERFPALVIRGDDVSRDPRGRPAAFRGFADPCIRRDPVSGDLWLAYSWPHVEYPGGRWSRPAVGVETHLARSGDGGRSWQRERVLWPKTAARFRDPRKGATRDGFISHEVPNLLPCPVEGKPAWLGVRLDYFLGRDGYYKDRDTLSFCLRLLSAPRPGALAGAPLLTFGHDMSSSECNVDVNLCRLSRDFPPVFLPNEPALFFADGRLFLVFVVMVFYGQTPDFAKSFVAVVSTEPRGATRSWRWRYHGKLATHAEARELGAESLTQVELALGRDGQILAFLTPESWNAEAAREFGGDAFGGIRHHGCAVVEVASLETPALARRKGGRLAVRALLHSSTASELGPGAAGYDLRSATGVLYTLRDTGDKRELSWSLHPTGLHP